MAALTTERLVQKIQAGAVTLPVKAATKIFAGSMVAVDSSGNALPATAATSQPAVGVAQKTVDNTTGAAGDLSVVIETSHGEVAYKMNSAAAGGLVSAKHIGSEVYITDDNTVTALSAGSSVAGVVKAIAADGKPYILFPT